MHAPLCLGKGFVADAEQVVALIGEPDRLRVFAALALGAPTVADVARMASLDTRTVERALARLVAGELVTVDDGVYRLVTEDILSAARDAAARRGVDDPDAPPAVAEILRRFMRGGKLTRVPMTRSKRLVVLDYLVQDFEPGRRYPEKEVNEMLRIYNDDVASLRRYMVDEGLLQRERGEYWRAGGTFEV